MDSIPVTNGAPTASAAQDGAGEFEGEFEQLYAAALEANQTALLGHLVLYSVYDGRVTPHDLENWFRELNLDPAFLPPALRPMDAFEKVTGPSGVRKTYPLDAPCSSSGKRRGRRPTDGTAREATLMIRHVRRDGGQIVRHVVREVRDERNTALSYDTRMAEVIFRRDNSAAAAIGDGELQMSPDHAAIAALPEQERGLVRQMLAEIEDSYRRGCAFLNGDRLRGVLRSYIEGLDAIRVRPTGGVYFVHRTHEATLVALRELVRRMGEGSHLSRIPLPDQEEMREMVIKAFTTRAKDDLDKLAADIAAAQREGKSTAAVQTLYKRFQGLQASAGAHSNLLSSSLEDTADAMKLVQAQLVSLLSQTEE